jgi:putative transposase
VKTRRYSETQVPRVLKEIESGMLVANAAREHGVSPATIHRWESKLSMVGCLSLSSTAQGTGRREHQAEANSSLTGTG